ncbi:MAG TPA: DUF4097 family beta strand repeat-containing protein [Longimicrobiales bacterium]
MQVTLTALSLLLVTALPLAAQRSGECDHEAQRSATVDANGARLLRLEAGSGSLKVEGKPGLNRVVVRGRACASSASLLEQITLTGQRSGAEVVIAANVQRDRNGWDFRDGEYARLDIVVEVPAGMAAQIDDGSGSMDLSNLGAVRVEDGSGEIVAHDLKGDVDIDDGSGEIRLVDVTGRVRIEDGSGSIRLENVGGQIDIDDASGEIEIRTARSSVRISDASGGIDVRDVAGDFIVTDDGSGGIDYDNVKGRVEIPRRKQR